MNPVIAYFLEAVSPGFPYEPLKCGKFTENGEYNGKIDSGMSFSDHYRYVHKYKLCCVPKCYCGNVAF